MKRKLFKMLSLSLAVLLLFSLAACGGGSDPTPTPGGDNPGGETTGYKIGWSTIYLTPSWMQQTKGMLDERAEYWKEKGVVSEYTIANANGDTSMQISQIENMISQGYDAIILIAGSSTALNPVVEKCAEQGVVVVNIDSLVTTDKVTSTINTSATEYGEVCAQWMADKLGGKGKIIMFSGPAGVQVSDERQSGAESILANYPDIEVVTTLNSEYNEAPALEIINPVLDANPDIDGILALGGAQASASLKAMQEKGINVPLTGENYNAFLKNWADLQDEGFTSIALGQPNWLGVLAMDQCIRILNGEDYEKDIIVPIPQITDDNLSEFVPNDMPDDGYPVADITEEDIAEFLAPKA